MEEEKKDEGAGDPLQTFLKESFEKKMNEMMYIFSPILWWMPIGDGSSSNNHLVGMTPFKVQVNFEIPIFEG